MTPLANDKPMEFVFLTAPEVEGVAIRWDENAFKSKEMVAAAVAAGFSEWEAQQSTLGVLEADFTLDSALTFRRGDCALLGMNGSVLLRSAGSGEAVE